MSLLHTDQAPPTPTQIRIGANSDWWGALDAGTRIVVRSGRIRLQPPPQWLDGQMLQVRTTLSAQQSMRVAHGGWVCVHAESDAVIVLLVAKPFHRRVGRVLAGALSCGLAFVGINDKGQRVLSK